MISVLIKERDQFFLKGLMDMLSDLFQKELKQSVHFAFEFSHENIASADVIIINLSPGEIFLCSPMLLSRTKGIIIGVLDVNDERKSKLPSCLDDILLMTRKLPVADVKKSIYTNWRMRMNISHKASCLDCRHRIPTQQQYRVMAGISEGKSMDELACELNMNVKTLFAHKYLLMGKFHLQTSSELQRFITCLPVRVALNSLSNRQNKNPGAKAICLMDKSSV